MISSVDNAIGTRKAVLEIFDVGMEAAGSYSCLVSNGVGQDLSKIITIKVLGKCFIRENSATLSPSKSLVLHRWPNSGNYGYLYG